jgi:hypothetical protein
MTDPTHDEDVRLVKAHIDFADGYSLDTDEALDRILARYDALVAEHETVRDLYAAKHPIMTGQPWGQILATRDAHDNAERVIGGHR